MAAGRDLAGRLNAASGPELLAAACAAFEVMLAVIRRHDQPGGRYFLAMVRAGAAAGAGRDWLLFAPSLRAPDVAAAGGCGPGLDSGGEAEAVRWLRDVCRVLAARLGEAAGSARLAEDRVACLRAAGCAREIAGLFGGGEP